jgi:hypothetical protein
MARGIEQLRQDVRSVTTFVKEKRNEWLTQAYPQVASKIMEGMEKRVIPAMSPEFPQGFEQELKEKLDLGGIPIVDINHQGHGDGLGGLSVAKNLIEMSKDEQGEPRIKGFVMLIAGTILTGDQGSTLQDMVGRIKSFTKEKYGVELEDYIREKDRIARGMSKAEMVHHNVDVVRRLRSKVREGYGIMFFPEGTIEGGRKDESGTVKGMQPFQAEILDSTVALVKRIGNPFHIPVGVDGTHNLQNVDHGNTPRTRLILGTLVHEAFLPALSVKVGHSVWQHELERYETPVAHQLGYLTSRLLEPEKQGFYQEVLFAES